MEFEFMTAGTPLPPCMPLPPVLLRLPASSTAKVMYARMLDEALAYGIEDENGILYIHFPIKELAAALSRSTMTIKRAMSELDDMGLSCGYGGTLASPTIHRNGVPIPKILG